MRIDVWAGVLFWCSQVLFLCPSHLFLHTRLNNPLHKLASTSEKCQLLPVSNRIALKHIARQDSLCFNLQNCSRHRKQFRPTASTQWLIDVACFGSSEVKAEGHCYTVALSQVTCVGSLASCLTGLVSFWTNHICRRMTVQFSNNCVSNRSATGWLERFIW
jgi:hypothetical protein